MKLRPATLDDSQFVYTVKVNALKSYVEQTWGWVEEEQREFHSDRFVPAATQIIQFQNTDVGFLCVAEEVERIALNEINILGDYQRMGIGTSLIRALIELADQNGKTLSLQVLKVNPAANLYRRLGFYLVGESETHYQMRYGRPSVR